MQRNLMENLIAWKTQPNRKPLILRGARQVGKTWLMREFGKIHFARSAYINFDNNPRMSNLFAGELTIPRLISALQIESGVSIDPHDTLIIFDEVQEVPRALTSLKYFHENAPEYAIIAAGSLLGVALHPGTSFPVGKVDFMEIGPFSFHEFLIATGNENLSVLLDNLDFNMISVFRERYQDLLKHYLFVGGMPEAVSTYLDTNDFRQVRLVQQKLLAAYEQDFSKHAPNETVPRIRMLWNSIPSQLARENRKFIYGQIKQSARSRDYELALLWLQDCGLVIRVNCISKPGMPLSAYQDSSAFKLYMLDVGLLGALSNLDATVILSGSRIFEEFKGALTEQYVLQQLKSLPGLDPYYWAAERATAEVDFIFQHQSEIIPLEVKAAENLQAKSLKSYCQKYKPSFSFRSSLSDYRREDWLVNLPLYAIHTIRQVIEAAP